MNPLTNIKNINKLNEVEERLGINPDKSWHQQYKDSAYIFVGGLPFDLSEGDIICVFSQYGEIMDINLVRDKKTGKSKGYCFICYEDQKSTTLSIDNMNGIKLLGRTIKVDHVREYRRPKDTGEEDPLTLKLRLEGIGPDTEMAKFDLDITKFVSSNNSLDNIKQNSPVEVTEQEKQAMEPSEPSKKANLKKRHQHKSKLSQIQDTSSDSHEDYGIKSHKRKKHHKKERKHKSSKH